MGTCDHESNWMEVVKGGSMTEMVVAWWWWQHCGWMGDDCEVVVTNHDVGRVGWCGYGNGLMLVARVKVGWSVEGGGMIILISDDSGSNRRSGGVLACVRGDEGGDVGGGTVG